MPEQSDHPCAPCAWFKPRTMRLHQMRFPVCTSPDRLPDESYEWTPCNKKGPDCKHYIEGEQLRLGGE